MTKHNFHNVAKRNISLITCIIVIAGSTITFQTPCFSQDGEALFKQACAACHSAGSNRLVGPGLKGITEKRSEEWLIKWTRSSQSLIKSGDKDAIEIFEQFNKIMMPDNNFSDAEIKSIYAFIDPKKDDVVATASETTDGDPQPEVVIASTNDATPEEILLGQRLYEGTTRFQNGGTSCLSCHNVESNEVFPGGLLAKDLTNSYSRLGGDAGLAGILNAPPFPAMTESYKNHPLTEQEVYAITAFLNKIDKDSTSATQLHAGMNPLLIYGIPGLIVWMAVVFMIWNNRKKNTVKLKIYERQLKSI